MREVERGVWHWEAPHPDWAGPENEACRQRLATTANTPNEAARGLVSSYAIDDGDRLLLFDPLAVPREIEKLGAGREPVVVLTSPRHERDTRRLVERLDGPVFTPPPDEGTPDVAWLLGGPSDAHLYSGGDRLPVGVEAFPGRLPNDVVLWIENSRAVIAGDTLVDFGQGLEIPVEWLPADVTREQVANGLEKLLDLPVEVVLATHGGPTDRAALVRALA
ncbi:MAG: MBL fold metallo-hydrolase [Actinomycetota bacterium]|nr:MBL fold metallo-hydrolase [Actinomycetota bacterium]